MDRHFLVAFDGMSNRTQGGPHSLNPCLISSNLTMQFIKNIQSTRHISIAMELKRTHFSCYDAILSSIFALYCCSCFSPWGFSIAKTKDFPIRIGRFVRLANIRNVRIQEKRERRRKSKNKSVWICRNNNSTELCVHLCPGALNISKLNTLNK